MAHKKNAKICLRNISEHAATGTASRSKLTSRPPVAYASAVSVLSDLEVAAEHQELHDISEMEAVGGTVLPRSQTCDRGPCVHVYYKKTFTRDMCSAYCRGVTIQIKRVAGGGESAGAHCESSCNAGDVVAAGI